MGWMNQRDGLHDVVGGSVEIGLSCLVLFCTQLTQSRRGRDVRSHGTIK